MSRLADPDTLQWYEMTTSGLRFAVKRNGVMLVLSKWGPQRGPFQKLQPSIDLGIAWKYQKDILDFSFNFLISLLKPNKRSIITLVWVLCA